MFPLLTCAFHCSDCLLITVACKYASRLCSSVQTRIARLQAFNRGQVLKPAQRNQLWVLDNVHCKSVADADSSVKLLAVDYFERVETRLQTLKLAALFNAQEAVNLFDEPKCLHIDGVRNTSGGEGGIGRGRNGWGGLRCGWYGSKWQERGAPPLQKYSEKVPLQAQAIDALLYIVCTIAMHTCRMRARVAPKAFLSAKVGVIFFQFNAHTNSPIFPFYMDAA